MYKLYRAYPYSYWIDTPMYNPYSYWVDPQMYSPYQFTDSTIYDTNTGFRQSSTGLEDYGPEPFVINIEEATTQNNTFRTALWTGKHLQVTLMSIPVGSDIGLEVHPSTDQFLRIEEGQGLVKMGDSRDNLNFQKTVSDDFAIVIPAGKWHNVVNTGNRPLKLYSIYAPPHHPHGTVHQTKADAEKAER